MARARYGQYAVFSPGISTAKPYGEKAVLSIEWERANNQGRLYSFGANAVNQKKALQTDVLRWKWLSDWNRSQNTGSFAEKNDVLLKRKTFAEGLWAQANGGEKE